MYYLYVPERVTRCTDLSLEQHPNCHNNFPFIQAGMTITTGCTQILNCFLNRKPATRTLKKIIYWFSLAWKLQNLILILLLLYRTIYARANYQFNSICCPPICGWSQRLYALNDRLYHQILGKLRTLRAGHFNQTIHSSFTIAIQTTCTLTFIRILVQQKSVSQVPYTVHC